MSLTLGTVITAARDRHPAFHKSRVPDAVLARYLTGYQRTLISKAADLEPSLVAQQASIVFVATPENAIGVAGVSTPGGLPGDLDALGNPVALNEDAGPLLEFDLVNAAVLVSERPVTSATATTLTDTTAAWAVNIFAGKLVHITVGPGAERVREIQSNTADTLTLKTGVSFDILPGPGSLYRIITPVLALTEGIDAVTELLPVGRRQGYLVRLDANGVPYLDTGKPIIATFDRGIDLPPHESVIGGTVRFITPSREIADLKLRPYRSRTFWEPYSAWIEAGRLFLAGRDRDWKDVDTLDLRYIPVAPEFTALSDLFLLPDTAYQALVNGAAVFAGMRVNALPDVPKVDLSSLLSNAEVAEAAFLNGVGRHNRAFAQYMQEVW